MNLSEEKNNLVRLLDLDPEFIIDLRYATEDNFTKTKVYESGECYIDRRTAGLLIKAKDMFLQRGYRVKIWDAYRPIHAQAYFWQLVPNPDFVSRPPELTPETVFVPRHLNGMSVDLTLTDMEGNELVMPTAFDDFTPQANLNCEEVTGEARRNGELLRDVMVEAGFSPDPCEWWHFDDAVHEPAPYLDVKIP